MAKKLAEPTVGPRERAFLVGVELFNQKELLTLSDSLVELAMLAKTAGLDVVGEITQKLKHPNSKTFVGAGKLEEIDALVEELQADVIIFDEELSARHLRELERKFVDQVRILDRTALILDIFAQHASTREGALQVELAQYEYRLPRLTRAWTHLARQAGGGSGRAGSTGGVDLRGPGETQLEVDRRDIRRRIDHLKMELEKVRTHRQQHRRRRRQSRIPLVTLVGYTNAGKSTLLNKLAQADVYVADKLFATLDPTTRRVDLPGGEQALFTDTVGFIQKLPTALVAAFRATLEEIGEADLLIHIVDITHPNARAQAESVQYTLGEIGADHIPVLTVLNKIDYLVDQSNASDLYFDFPESVAISALRGDGIKELLNAIRAQLFEKYENITVRLPYKQGNLISLFHDTGQVDSSAPYHGGVLMQGKVPGRLMAQFQPFVINPDMQLLETMEDDIEK